MSVTWCQQLKLSATRFSITLPDAGTTAAAPSSCHDMPRSAVMTDQAAAARHPTAVQAAILTIMCLSCPGLFKHTPHPALQMRLAPSLRYASTLTRVQPVGPPISQYLFRCCCRCPGFFYSFPSLQMRLVQSVRYAPRGPSAPSAYQYSNTNQAVLGPALVPVPPPALQMRLVPSLRYASTLEARQHPLLPTWQWPCGLMFVTWLVVHVYSFIRYNYYGGSHWQHVILWVGLCMQLTGFSCFITGSAGVQLHPLQLLRRVTLAARNPLGGSMHAVDRV
jgi:hypothetical protein